MRSQMSHTQMLAGLICRSKKSERQSNFRKFHCPQLRLVIH
jgi:hypothetical protein